MFLELQELAKSFGSTRVLDGLSLELAEGEILALLGPSGSGKTTALRLLAGFENPDHGTIRIGGQDVTTLAPARRGIGMVFQHYALFPHMSVFDNVVFGLETQDGSAEEHAARVREVLGLVDMSGYEDRPVSAISGGQQQRIALARALAPRPRVLLLDEPLSNLDPTLRERTRRELRQAIRQIGITTVLVTHEQDEAFYLGDRVAVLHQGRLEQIGRPQELYDTPRSRFVASFVGRASLLKGRYGIDSDGTPGVHLDLPGSVHWPGVATEPLAPDSPAELMVRPEALRVGSEKAKSGVAGTIRERRFTGPLTYYSIELEPGLVIEVTGPSSFEKGQLIFVELKREAPPARIFRQDVDT